ncbi:LacI family DNA-binding transcriptional regulator [Agrococcus sp. SGAir0287]|uniref:LacI family DNA-binding transcriptional regulator n=1 Tax=Agrococcus sp. SGAir0287 TaxID=2070347 RepID=UPI0015869203|nr:LacI family DNA-binding transcriptional regulator [Agrococcus sp. SGAir0287]
MAEGSTLAAVAARAGVSIASASRALNGGIASTATIARVQQAADDLGYRPNLMARGLQSGRTGQVAMLVPDAANPVYARMMSALQSELDAHGIRLLMQQVPAEPVDAIDALSAGLVDGAVVVALRVTDALVRAVRRAAVPVVVLGLVEAAGIDSVRADSRSGMALLVEHLASRGAHRVGLVVGPTDTTPGRTRLDGFVAACRAQGVDAGLVEVAEDFTHAAARPAARALLARGVPDAIVAANDAMALATLRECATLGLRVPHDLLLAGLDDTEPAELSVPSLTSVDLGAHERARIAARTLLARIDGAGPSGATAVAPRLVVRESTTEETA